MLSKDYYIMKQNSRKGSLIPLYDISFPINTQIFRCFLMWMINWIQWHLRIYILEFGDLYHLHTIEIIFIQTLIWSVFPVFSRPSWIAWLSHIVQMLWDTLLSLYLLWSLFWSLIFELVAYGVTWFLALGHITVF